MLLVALALLMAAPIISYFYLNEGYQYRISSLQELEIKGEINPFNLAIDTVTSFSDDDLKGKITAVLFLEGNDEERQYVTDLVDQFGERREFQLLVLAPSTMTWESKPPVTVVRSPEDGSRNFLSNTFSDTLDWKTPSFVLVDTSAQIRHYYQGNWEVKRKKLVEHIAIILPRTKKSDIIHKNDLDEE